MECNLKDALMQSQLAAKSVIRNAVEHLPGKLIYFIFFIKLFRELEYGYAITHSRRHEQKKKSILHDDAQFYTYLFMYF
jgi:hypothetical protein